jgi:hypothetical protein
MAFPFVMKDEYRERGARRQRAMALRLTRLT